MIVFIVVSQGLDGDGFSLEGVFGQDKEADAQKLKEEIEEDYELAYLYKCEVS